MSYVALSVKLVSRSGINENSRLWLFNCLIQNKNVRTSEKVYFAGALLSE